MSTTIESRVVEMQFDNKQFEHNVSNTMSTLDKLKAKLNFSGASKGLEDVNAAAKGVNMSGLGSAVETVSAKFSALQVMGVTALANLTNSAVNAGKRIVSALTIDPIKTGFEEYETQINAVQTILANTESKGTTIDDVNAALEELNKYADMTIYNFTEMTRNIGTFTAAGVDLDTSVSAIQGIANLAAVSGSTSQQASTAMYQLSQALSTGTVKLQDWNSVVNAGMGGQVFQDALIRTAAAMAGAADNVEAWRKENIDSFGSFRDSLTQGGWLTTDVLTETLNQFTMAAEEGSKEWEAYKKSLMDTGYTEKQAEEILKMANTATDAATKVKTFTQLWDVLKEAAQSGWTQTWKLLIGDFEEAKNLLTPLSDIFTNLINKMSDFRNNILEGALGKSFSNLGKLITGITKPVAQGVTTVADTFNSAKNAVGETVGAITDLGEVVNKVIRGDFGNGADRYDALTAAGLNYYEVQNKVNEQLGNSFRHSEDVIQAQNELLGTQKKTAATAEESAKAQNKVNASQAKQIETLAKLDEKELESLGYTKKQIAAFKELEVTAEKLGIPIEELINNIDEIDGRWLLIESIKNAGKGLVEVFNVIKDAWVEIFPPKSIEERSEQLFNVIAAVHKFSRSLVGVIYQNGELTETGEKLLRTLKGVFAIIDIVSTVVGGAFRTALKVVVELLGRFDLNILDVTAAVGDAIVGFRDWIDSVVSVSDVVDALVPIVKSAAKFISNLITTVKNSKWFNDFCNYVEKAAVGLSALFKSISGTSEFKNLVTVLKNAGTSIREWIGTLKDSENLPRDIIAGLAKGIREGGPEVIAAVFDLAKSIILGICEALGIHSPSTAMIAIGGFIIAGLVLGLQNGVDGIWPAIQEIGAKIVEWFKSLDLGTIIGVGLSIALFSVFKTIGNALSVLAAPLEGIGEMCEKIGGAFDALKAKFKADAWEKRARAVLMFAAAIAILVGAVYAISFLDAKKLWTSIGAIAALAGILALLAFAIGKLGPTEDAELGKFALVLLGLSGSLLIISFALKQMAYLSTNDLIKGGLAMVGVTGILVGLVAATKLVGQDANKAASTLIKMTIVMALLVGVAKLAASLDPNTVLKGGIAILAFGGVMLGLVAMTKLFNKDANKVGSTLLKMTIAMMLMVGVIKLAALLDAKTVLKAAPAILAFVGIFAGLALVTKLGGDSINKLGSTLLAMSSAMLLMAVVIKMFAGMSKSDIAKGIFAVGALAVIIGGLVAATNLVGKNELKRISTTILTMSISIGILALVAAMLGMLSVEHLVKGVTAVTILGGIVTAMIWATRGAEDCKGNLIVMTIAIGLLVASVAALSLIETDRLIGASASLALVMGMFALIVKSANTAKGAIAPLIVMTGAIAVLAGILWVLSGLPVESTLATAASLSVLILALSAALFVASKAGPMAAGALIAIGIMTIIVGALAGILYLVQSMPVESTLSTALALSELLIVMTAVCAVMSFIPVAAAAQGALGLAAFIGVMTGVIAALGGLAQIPGFNELIADGGQTLSAIGYAIGDFVGSIVGGFSSGFTSALPEIGKNLSNFIANATPFIDKVSTLDMGMLGGVAALSGAILALTASNLIYGVGQFFTFGSSFAQLGSDLSGFMVKAGVFISAASKIDPNMVTGVKALAETILILTAANLIEGLASFITGGSSLTEFGAQLPTLATHINSFATNLGTFDESKVATVKCAADAIKALAEAANEIPNEGGWAGKIFGENSLATFGAQLPLMGINLRNFATNLGTFDEAKVATVKCAADAIKTLADAADAIPNEGGWAAKIFGENSLASFGSQLPLLGINLGNFAKNLGTFDEATVATVGCAAEAIKVMAQAAEGIDGQAEWAKKLFGDNGLAAFGDQLAPVGSDLKAFVTNLGTFTNSQVSTTRAAVDAIKAFAELANADLKSAKKNLEGFGEKLGGFGTDLVTFCANMPSTASVNSAVTSIKNILSTIDKVAAANTGALGDLADNLKKVGGDAVNKFIGAFTSETAKINIKDAADTLADKAVSGLDGLDTEAESAGEDLGSGLVRGIKAKYDDAYDAGYALGQKAVQGEKDGQASNSPSKLTILAGKWLGEGLVIGIGKMGRKVYESGSELGSTAIDSISSTVSKIADIVNSDIDAQPTISPVLDLSNVRTGAAAIDDMLGVGSTMRVLANANGINASINHNRQNGANSEVVSAINKLRKDLANVGNTTYSINGVTYDDGSNVSEAIKSIARYAMIERRV